MDGLFGEILWRRGGSRREGPWFVVLKTFSRAGCSKLKKQMN